MPQGPNYTLDEDTALMACRYQWQGAWRQHVREFSAINSRPLASLIARLAVLEDTFRDISNTAAAAWPEPGTIIFTDDPKAHRDHGSPGRIERTETRFSSAPSSARWAVI